MARFGNTSSSSNRDVGSYRGQTRLNVAPVAKPAVKAQDTGPKRPGLTDSIRETADRAGDLSKQFTQKNIPLFKPTTVTVNPAQVAQIGVPTGSREMNVAIADANANIGQAGRIDPQVAAYLRAAQQSGQYSPQAIGMMQQAAMGQGPSAAQAQLQAGVDQSIQAQMAAAASRGFSPAAMRGAQMQSAQMQQQALNQAAQLRAQEQQAAQQSFLQASLQQEEMQRQAALQAGQTTLQQEIAKKDAIQNAINAQLQGSGQLLQSGTQLATTQAQLQQQAALADQEAMLRAGMFNNQIGLQARELQQQGELGYGGLGIGAMGQQFSGLGTLYAGAQAKAAQDAQMRQTLLGGLLGAGGAVGAAALSDRNAKTDIRTNKETQAFLNALTDNEYRYKDTSQAGTAPGKQYGPMAQDLEKTPMGRTAVIEGPNGKMVDSARGFLLALSGLANLNQRLAKLEG
jgi:hypothetical protein